MTAKKKDSQITIPSLTENTIGTEVSGTEDTHSRKPHSPLKSHFQPLTAALLIYIADTDRSSEVTALGSPKSKAKTSRHMVLWIPFKQSKTSQIKLIQLRKDYIWYTDVSVRRQETWRNNIAWLFQRNNWFPETYADLKENYEMLEWVKKSYCKQTQ